MSGEPYDPDKKLPKIASNIDTIHDLLEHYGFEPIRCSCGSHDDYQLLDQYIEFSNSADPMALAQLLEKIV